AHSLPRARHRRTFATHPLLRSLLALHARRRLDREGLIEIREGARHVVRWSHHDVVVYPIVVRPNPHAVSSLGARRVEAPAEATVSVHWLSPQERNLGCVLGKPVVRPAKAIVGRPRFGLPRFVTRADVARLANRIGFRVTGWTLQLKVHA